MEYLAQFAAFLVALFGITGDTWDKRKPGLLKFTRTGWIIASLAVVILAVSASLAYRANVEKRNIEDQKAAVRSIARMELCLAALHLKIVLDVMTSNATGAMTDSGADIGFDNALLLNPETIEALKQFNLMERVRARPLAGDFRSLDRFIAEESKEFVDLTNIALAKYSTFLGKELILDATRLAADNLVRRFLVTAEQVEQVRNNGSDFYPALWGHEAESFQTVVKLLQSLREKTGSRELVLACEQPDFFK